MTRSAVLFGSIGVIAETSDIQRRAYNRAFAEANLTWHWDEDTYRQLLSSSGGKERLARLSHTQGPELTDTEIERLHSRKTDLACAEILETGLGLRPGIMDTIALARHQGAALGFVTSTYRQNIDAILEAAGLSLELFDTIIDRGQLARPKPDPEAYRLALTNLHVHAENAIAIEDTAISAMAAKNAGITTLITPGVFTDRQQFPNSDFRFVNLKEAFPMLTAWAETHSASSVEAA
ncbi:MAG: HAD-IA family hydrolase [Pseudomonadota bacterium]